MVTQRSLQNIFPPPLFLQMPSIGVDVSDTSLKYVQLIATPHSSSPFNVATHGDIDIAEGSLHRGIVQNPQSLIEALQEMSARTGVKMVRLSLPEERAYLFETTIKRTVAEKDIRSLLEFRLEENVPLSPRDALFDYTVIPTLDPSEAEVKVSVTVYSIETILSYYEACVSAGLMPLSFEVEAQAISRATILPKDPGTHLIVDFGKTRTGVGIVHNGVLMYTSTIEIGGGDMSKSLRTKLGDVPESELTTLKNTQGLVPQKESAELTLIMQQTIDSIIKEIQMRIEYWHSNNAHEEDRFIESIILCGGSVNMKGIQRYVADSLKIDTYRADVWRNVLAVEDMVPPIPQRYAYGYATAIGLALGQYHM